MHSRIFIIKNVDSKQEKRYEEDELFERMDKIADYVVPSYDMFDDWQWFLKVHQTFMSGDWEEKTITIYFDKLEDYYEEKTETLKSMVNKLNKRNWQYWDLATYSIQKEINDEFGFYVADEHDDLNTSDVWLSLIYGIMLKENLDKMTFKLIQTFDYHS